MPPKFIQIWQDVHKIKFRGPIKPTLKENWNKNLKFNNINLDEDWPQFHEMNYIEMLNDDDNASWGDNSSINDDIIQRSTQHRTDIMQNMQDLTFAQFSQISQFGSQWNQFNQNNVMYEANDEFDGLSSPDDSQFND